VARGKQRLTDPAWRLEEDRLALLGAIAGQYPASFDAADPPRIWQGLGQTGEPPGWFVEAVTYYCGAFPDHPPAEVLMMYARLEPSSGFLRAPALPPLEPLPNETEAEFLERARTHLRKWREAHLEAGVVADEWPQRREHLRWLAWHLVEGLGVERIARRLEVQMGEAAPDFRAVARGLAKARERLMLR
jgi:hypothetical protein